GHAPGAVWMRIGGEDGLLYTGDISAESLMFRASLPPRAAAMVLDASYGLAAGPLRDQIAAITDLVDGPVLFPSPAGGRGLEIAATFLRLGLPVSICLAHRRVAATLAAHMDWLTPEGRRDLALLDGAGDLTADAPLHGVMVAAGPNVERGTAQALALRIAVSGGARIIFTGHVAHGSPAEALITQGHAEFRRWNVHPPFAEASALVAAVAPRTMLAAFCDPDTLATLRSRTDWPIAPGESLIW
ncbi:MAG: MBL fold metallo-hydrolase, partial [Hyphomonas sp.]